MVLVYMCCITFCSDKEFELSSLVKASHGLGVIFLLDQFQCFYEVPKRGIMVVGGGICKVVQYMV